MSPPTQLKPTRARRLRGGLWVLVAAGSEPLVVSGEDARALTQREARESDPPLETLAGALNDAGFVAADTSTEPAAPPEAPSARSWKVGRTVLWAATIVLGAVAAILLIRDGLPTGADVISTGPHPLIALAVGIGIAVVTAVPHEFAHIAFGRTFRQHRGSVRVDARRASATANLTHVWAWPLSARLAAVAAGLTVDLGFLVAALVIRATTGSWIAMVGVAVLVMRIVWQLRFHRTCDGRHIAKMLIDNPIVEVDARHALTRRTWSTAPVATWAWIGLVVLGVVAELSLIVVWIGPAVLRLLGVL